MAKRRRHGEGSVYQRKSDGKWMGVMDLGWQNGKRIRKTITANTERQAVRKLRELIHGAERGVIPETVTVTRWMQYWMDDVANVKASTMVGYRSAVRNYIDPTIGHVRLDRLTPEHVRGMHQAVAAKKSSRSGRPLSPTTARLAHSVLRKALSDALAEGKVYRNVAQLAGAPKGAGQARHEALTVEQAVRVLSAAKDDARLRCRLICALHLGMRQGEALGLQWTDVRQDGGAWSVSIRETVQQIRGQGVVIGTPKSARSVRTIPLPPIAAAAFEAYRKQSTGRGFVFHGFRGPSHPEGSKRDWQAWTDALAAAGVPHVPLHGARATSASLLQSLGVPDRWIADILGHAQVRTSQHHYLRSDPDQLRQALTMSEQAFSDGQVELES